MQDLFNVRDNRECLHVPRTLPEWRDKLYIVENYSKWNHKKVMRASSNCLVKSYLTLLTSALPRYGSSQVLKLCSWLKNILVDKSILLLLFSFLNTFFILWEYQISKVTKMTQSTWPIFPLLLTLDISMEHWFQLMNKYQLSLFSH